MHEQASTDLDVSIRLARFCHSAGYFENFRLEVPKGALHLGPQAGGDHLPKVAPEGVDQVVWVQRWGGVCPDRPSLGHSTPPSCWCSPSCMANSWSTATMVRSSMSDMSHLISLGMSMMFMLTGYFCACITALLPAAASWECLKAQEPSLIPLDAQTGHRRAVWRATWAA